MIEYPYLSEALSNVIEIIRVERDLSKSELAEFSFLERKYLWEIERGTKKPTVNVAFLICDALKISPDIFFKRVEEERKKLLITQK